jgi:hypothetical protein
VISFLSSHATISGSNPRWWAAVSNVTSHPATENQLKGTKHWGCAVVINFMPHLGNWRQQRRPGIAQHRQEENEFLLLHVNFVLTG